MDRATPELEALSTRYQKVDGQHYEEQASSGIPPWSASDPVPGFYLDFL